VYLADLFGGRDFFDMYQAPQQVGEFSKVHSNPARLILRQQLGR
jgi:hypothetical protein